MSPSSRLTSRQIWSQNRSFCIWLPRLHWISGRLASSSNGSFLFKDESCVARSRLVHEHTSMSKSRIDLVEFSIDGFALGDHRPGSLPDVAGVELVEAGSSLCSIGVDVGEYDGVFTRSGNSVDLNGGTSPSDVKAILGEPFWEDADEDELILFYEFERGHVEIQFEFPDAAGLGYLTLAKPGLMSNAEQRNAYGVDKPWPPEA